MATQQDDFYDIRKKGPECEPFDRHPWPDRGVPETDDQLPTFSKVGRGIQGDSYRVDVVYDDLDETYLKGFAKDSASGTWSEDWTSENINGGNLTYQFAIRPYTIPKTFTITFDYSRPERGGWTMTTPAIPYLGDPDAGLLTGISTLFLREKSSSSWPSSIADSQTSHTINQSMSRLEKLLYPDGEVRSHYNAPVPGDPWTVNLQYGIGGDINCPSLTDLAKILGVTPDSIETLASNPYVPTDTFGGKNVKQYIDGLIGDFVTNDHIHGDMGFGDILINDGNNDTKTPKRNTIKKWIDWIIGQLGFGTDIDDFDDLPDVTTIKDYIDVNISDVLADSIYHLHKDLGFGIPSPLAGDNGSGVSYTRKTDGVVVTALDTVKKYIDAIATDVGDIVKNLGFNNGNDGFDFPPGIDSVKEYIDNIQASIENPKLYKITKEVYLVFYNLGGTRGIGAGAVTVGQPYLRPAGSMLFDYLVANENSIAVRKAHLYISYFDVLPQVEFDLQIDLNQPNGWAQNYTFNPGDVGVACEIDPDTNRYVPINFTTVNLPNRASNLKAPLLNPENLSNCGFSPDVFDPDNTFPETSNAGTWQVYTGVGDLKTTSSTDAQWPWGLGTPAKAFFYMINRNSEYNCSSVTINYYRTYSCSYNQATIG